METNLNKLLADLVVEYHKLQSYHWYIKGKDFFTVHAKLEELYNGINKAIDEVAEAILMTDHKPVATMKEFLEISAIDEAKAEHIKSKEIYEAVLSDFKYLLDSIKSLKNEADETNEYLISSLMDDYIKEFTKSIWMINQVVEK